MVKLPFIFTRLVCVVWNKKIAYMRIILVTFHPLDSTHKIKMGLTKKALQNFNAENPLCSFCTGLWFITYVCKSKGGIYKGGEWCYNHIEFAMDGHVIAESWNFCRQRKRICELKLCESMEKLTTDSAEPEPKLLVVADHSIQTAGKTIDLLFVNTCMTAWISSLCCNFTS